MVQYVDLLSDTICSPITAPGHSGVSVIRISGERSGEITKKLLKSLPDRLESHRAYFGFLKNSKHEDIDQVLVTFFDKGRSFTGDETVEISCHGNPLIVNGIVDLYLQENCRAAERGEFSFRAFYNGKIDLVQAESIHQLVTTNNRTGSDTSLKHLKGDLSTLFLKIENDLVMSISHLEATIDFVEQDIDPDDYRIIANKLLDIRSEIDLLVESYDIGKNIKEGFRVLLLGPSNVGKSSLFNCLFKEEKAIVTDIAGTTRDLVTGQTFLGHNVVEFVDSAGIRESSDKVENIGIQKSLNSIDTCDLILYTLDVTKKIDLNFIKSLPEHKSFFIFNKKDLLETDKDSIALKNIIQQAGLSERPSFFVSALTGDGVVELKTYIENYLSHSKELDGKSIVTQARHYNHLLKISKSVSESLKLLEVNESPDIISQELAFGLSEMNLLLGKEYDDEILDKIFGEFCIGK